MPNSPPLLHLYLLPSDLLLLSSTLSAQIEQNKLLAERTPRLATYATEQIAALSSLQSTLSLTLSSLSYSPTLPAVSPTGTTHFEENPSCPTPSSQPTP